jgi:DNA-directed RNA polymerase specialized sigma24 family protein
VKPRFKTLKQAITLPQVIAYIDKCIEHGAGVAESEIEDIRQDILMKLYVLPEDLPLDSKRDKWKGYLSTVVKRHLIDRRRLKTGNDRLVFTHTASGRGTLLLAHFSPLTRRTACHRDRALARVLIVYSA